MTIPTHSLSTGVVAKVLEISTQAVRNLDAELQPVRAPNGRRLYSPIVVEAVARARASRSAR